MDRLIESPGDLNAALTAVAQCHRVVFFAGLPGVGKSLFIRELARVATARGQAVHLLQWDVARLPFEVPAIAARYPGQAGATHPAIRRAVGIWARAAVCEWRQRHAGSSTLLIGEVPLIGNRLLELAQVHADAAESLLAGPEVLFVTPVPSVAVRTAIEQARARTFAHPTHPGESADAPPHLLHQLWLDTHALAVQIGAAAPAVTAPVPYEPSAYAAVYRHLLRHRRAITLNVHALLDPRTSAYDLAVEVERLIPSEAQALAVLAQVERENTPGDIERQVASWFELS